MAENCTVYCKVHNFADMARLLHLQFPEPNPTNRVSDSIVVHGTQGSLRLTTEVFRESGDDFCRLLLSTCAFIEGKSNADAEVKKRLASHVESCALVVGVVAEPAFDSDQRYHAAVFAIAEALDGIIFNGHEMLNANGETLIAAV